MLALLTVVLGSVLCWLLMAIQQYAWDELTGGRLPYVPDAWYGAYQNLYERFGAAGVYRRTTSGADSPRSCTWPSW